MTRRKVNLTFIEDDSSRKTSYKKRKKGILKKVKELTILCGIEACAIIYSDFDGNKKPQIWPSPSGVERVITNFKRYSQVDQHRKMLNLETYMKERVNRAKEHLEKIRKDNREKEMTLLMNQYLAHGEIFDNNLTMVDLNDLAWVIGQKIDEINHRLSVLNLNSASSSSSQAQQQKHEVEENHQVAVAAVAAAKNEVADQGQDRGKGVLEMNMDDTQELPWYLNLINGGEDENQLLSFDNDDLCK